MKFFRLDLLTLLISLFILNSCKNKDTIGLGLDSSTQLNGSLIDTSTIVVNTLPEDSVITSGLPKTPLGYFIDPIMGTTESNIAAALNLPGSTAYSLPTGTITIDSAVLVLHYADGFYGDSITSKYKVNVYQLGIRPLSKAYYNTDSWTANLGSLVGTRSFFARTHDSIKIYNIITGQPDTLIKVVPQLRIPIDKNFVNSILFNASSAQLASNTVFLNNVKGLYITLDKTATTGAGGTIMLSLADSLNVYYRAINGTTIDTALVQLPLSTHSAEIKRTPSTALKTEFANTSSSRDLIYLQGLAGTKVKIKFPYLKNIIPTIGSNIVINRAELVVTPNPGSTIPFKPQPKLTMYRYDIAHQPSELEDANPSDHRSQGVSVFGGFYSPALNSYHFIVTAYVQDLMNGTTVDYGTYLAPVDTTNTTSVDINPTPQTAGRVIAVGTDKNSPYRIKLNIIYTKINK
ncbi:MAG: hypothetical protein JWQ66_4257 [Mucilaginibacter sp.]|nr:hypothetical protein [Mucilaginibacter sp.]